jgi:serine/threonine protein phosphatase 1
MKTFVVGDIHGAGLELEVLLEKMSPSTDDRILLVGDLFDRGLHAVKVWELIVQHRIKSFLGNHEAKMSAYLQGRYSYLPPHYYVAMNLLVESGVAPNELAMFLQSLPLLEDYGHFIVTHAGVRLDNPSIPDNSANVYGSLPPDQAMPIPEDGDGKKYWWDGYQGDKLIIYGHLVTRDNLPRIRRRAFDKRINSVGLDTAAVHGGALTGICVEDFKFFSHRSGVDWGKQVKDMIKVAPPVVHPDILAYVAVQKAEQTIREMIREQTVGV